MQEQQKITKIPFWRSLRLKFALSYVALIVAVLGLLNSYPIFVSQDMVFKAKLTSLQNQAAVIASTVASMEELTREGVTPVSYTHLAPYVLPCARLRCPGRHCRGCAVRL